MFATIESAINALEAEVRELLERPDDFIAYLSDKTEQEVVGMAHQCSTCPLAVYLKARLGISRRFVLENGESLRVSIAVHPDAVFLTVGLFGCRPLEREIRLNPWSKALIDGVDAIGRLRLAAYAHGGRFDSDCYSVTRADCNSVLADMVRQAR